ncbi:hypothetical protein D3C77_509680 [compost metagenome]
MYVPRHAVTQIVLWQHEASRFGEQLRLVLLHPQDFRQREAFQCSVSGNVQQLVAELRFNLPALLCRAGIIPQNGMAQYFILIVQQYKPVHLAGERNAFDILCRNTAALHKLFQAGYCTFYPFFRILLTVPGTFMNKRISCCSFALNFTVFTDQQRLDRTGSQINTDYIFHP